MLNVLGQLPRHITGSEGTPGTSPVDVSDELLVDELVDTEAAELEDHLLQVASGDPRNRCTGRVRTCQGDTLHPGIGDQVRDLLVGRVQVDVRAFRKPIPRDPRRQKTTTEKVSV